MYKKIDIFLRNTKGFWQYETSTKWLKTCKEAKARFLEVHSYLDISQVKARFTKN